MSGRRRPFRLMGAIGRLACRQQRADLSVAVLQWAPVGAARPLEIVGVGRTCVEAQAHAFALVGYLATRPRPGLS